MPPESSSLSRSIAGNIVHYTSIESLYRQHLPWLTGWLRKRLDCPFDAEDLVQDTFVRVIRSQESMTTLREPHNYLLTIARGLAIDLFRRRTLEQQYLITLSNLPELKWPSEERKALILELLLEADAMLDGLGRNVKQVFILSKFEGLTYPNIAQQLKISLRTVNHYMAKATEHCLLNSQRQDWQRVAIISSKFRQIPEGIALPVLQHHDESVCKLRQQLAS
ncbi:MAG: sigma-70 family RNA polymerase sigma factor [Oleispira sp.]|nr:sigma-70 family RNA polymerase sigma factor [Oleispira sp.]MBL4880849.1 sigma-70 family RNA polymerase sigma factor [Oleispira sp.]